MTEPTVGAVLDELAAGLGDATRDTSGSEVTWSAGGTAFAAVAGDTVELRLDRAVAAAALRTPDTSPSNRGSEWVRYAPGTLEGHDLDRLEAWFALAHRRAIAPAPTD